MSLVRRSILVAGAVVLWAGMAVADPIYYATLDGQELIRVDAANGTTVVVGPLTYPYQLALAVAPDGTLWTITETCTAAKNLATVDPATGTTTKVGGPMAALGSECAPALEFDAAGNLFGLGHHGTFFSVDKVTGQANVIGDAGDLYWMDVAFDTAGTLWAVDECTGLYTINLATGASSFVTNISGASDCVMSIAFDAVGQLYGITYDFPAFLYTIDTASGVATQVGGAIPLGWPHGGDIVWPTAVDHYKGYKAKTAKTEPKQPKFETTDVTLVDQFESKLTTVKNPFFMCNPADTNDWGIDDPTAHLQCYQIKDAKTEPKQAKFEGSGPVTVTNRFGFRVLEVKKPKLLCVPSEKDGVASALSINHYKCYQAKDWKTDPKQPKFETTDVTLVDQFETKQTDVKKAFMLCNPVDKEGGGILDPEVHQVCYKIKDTKTDPKQVKFEGTTAQTANQFGGGINDEGDGAELLEVKKPKVLCVPSKKFLDPICGDDVVNQASEACDGTDNSGCASEACLPDCTCAAEAAAPICGDDAVNTDGEECDGTDYSACVPYAPAVPGTCLGDCTCPVGVAEDLQPCTARDEWNFAVSNGQSVVVVADTVDSTTAADLDMSISCTTGDSAWINQDYFLCTYPPPAWGCPRGRLTATGDGTCTVTVLGYGDCANVERAEYQLIVVTDGVEPTLTQTEDDAVLARGR